MNKGILETKCVDQRIEELELKRIITTEYQRPINVRRVEKIALEFDPAKLGLLVVSDRSDGYYAILDGQHRLAALRERGMNRGMAIVLKGMTLEQEADYFRRQNDNRMRLDSYDLYNAGLVAKDHLYLCIDEMLRNHDFIACRTSGPKQVTALATLLRIAKHHGPDVLSHVLGCIRAAWPTDPMAVRREFLVAITEFVLRFGRQVTPELFALRMGSRVPSNLYYEYCRRTEGRATVQNAFDRKMRYTFCAVLVDAYNKGLSSNSRLRLRLEWDMPLIECAERGRWQ